MKDELLLMLLQKGISLRDAKYAVTKYRVLEYFNRGIDETDILSKPISKVCKELGISRATFFNYFSRIEDVFLYQIQIWLYELCSYLKTSYNQYSAKELLLNGTDMFSELLSKNDFYMKYYLRLSTLEGQNSKVVKELTEAERLVFGLNENLDPQPVLSAKLLIDVVYKKAIDNNEIENILKSDEVTMLFHMILTGGISYADIHRDKSLNEVLKIGINRIIDILKWK